MKTIQASKAPPKCNQAIARLERAVARLEKAVQSQSPLEAAQNRKLEAELAQMRAIAQSVAQRLDGTIGRVRSALEN